MSCNRPDRKAYSWFRRVRRAMLRAQTAVAIAWRQNCARSRWGPVPGSACTMAPAETSERTVSKPSTMTAWLIVLTFEVRP